MSLYSISGIGCNDCEFGTIGDDNYIGGRRRRRERRQSRRARRKARKEGINCKGAKVKKVLLSAPRNAYLALVRLNVKKLAVKLARATSTPEGRKKVHGKWCKLGGNGAKLQSAIDKAYAKYKRKRGIIGYMDDTELASIGVVTTATIIATATPIIAALAPLLKQFGGEKGEEIAETAEAVAEEAQPEEQPAETGENAEVGAIGINPWLIGGGALALYFLLKKRK
jgi:hypothetical protein